MNQKWYCLKWNRQAVNILKYLTYKKQVNGINEVGFVFKI